MKARLVNEAIKRLEPRSKEELLQNYSMLDAGEKIIEGFKHHMEFLIKVAIKENSRFKEIGNLYLKNPIYSVEMDTAINVDKNGKFKNDKDGKYFSNFLKEHNISYKIIDLNPGGNWPIFEYTGKLRDIIDLLLGPFDSGLEGEDEVEELEFWLGLA